MLEYHSLFVACNPEGTGLLRILAHIFQLLFGVLDTAVYVKRLGVGGAGYSQASKMAVTPRFKQLNATLKTWKQNLGVTISEQVPVSPLLIVGRVRSHIRYKVFIV